MTNRLNLFENKYYNVNINNKEYEIKGLSLKDMLEDSSIFKNLFDVVLEMQEMKFIEEQELFIDKYINIVNVSVKNFSLDNQHDVDNFSDLIIQILDFSLPPKIQEQYEEPSKGRDIKTKKDLNQEIKAKKLELYKHEYLKRLDIEESLYNYVELAEFLRTKNINDPYNLSLKNLIVLTQIHTRIENNKILKDLDMYTSAISIFKIKDSKIYESFVTRMM